MARKIYLDLDGVMAAQVAASLKRLNLPADFVWPAGVWDYTAATGVPAKEVWARMNDHAFWADEIQPLPHARELFETAVALVGLRNVRIATKPTLSPFSASGKVAWVQQHFPELSRQFSIIIDKDELARPGHVLVDDSPANVDAWRAAGGDAVLWPNRQNYRYAVAPETALEELRRLFDGEVRYSPVPLRMEALGADARRVIPHATLEQLKCGTVVIQDGCGTEIRMSGGNVELRSEKTVYWAPRNEV